MTKQGNDSTICASLATWLPTQRSPLTECSLQMVVTSGNQLTIIAKSTVDFPKPLCWSHYELLIWNLSTVQYSELMIRIEGLNPTWGYNCACDKSVTTLVDFWFSSCQEIFCEPVPTTDWQYFNQKKRIWDCTAGWWGYLYPKLQLLCFKLPEIPNFDCFIAKSMPFHPRGIYDR